MLSKGLLTFVSVSFAIGANAANDWAKPCFDGECAYDLPESSGGSGILKLVRIIIYVSDKERSFELLSFLVRLLEIHQRLDSCCWMGYP